VARLSLTRLSPRRRTLLAALALVGGLGAAALLAAAGGLLEGTPEGIDVPPGGPGAATLGDVAEFEPFAFEEGSPEEFLERGRDGYSHPLYALSPGGAAASAARVERFRSRIEGAAARHGVDPDTLEALVLLESAGRPDVAAGGDPEGAVGLGQILPGTATGLLGMSVDLEVSKRVTREIEGERRRARKADSSRGRRAAMARAGRLERRRRAVDERYDPTRALNGAARYLAFADRRFGREDLALASYHMGIGNLENVIEAYVAPARPERTTRATVEEFDLSYARLLYDSAPTENTRTYALLAGFGDDSRSYLFRVEAAREIMRLHRQNPGELARLARLHTLWPSGELVLRPPGESDAFVDPEGLAGAYEDGDLLALPNERERLGFELDPGLGRLANRAEDGDPRLYRGLRPEALATLLFITKEVRRVAGKADLRVTDAVRDRAYGRSLAFDRPGTGEPPRSYSTHDTGYAFDIARDYASPRVGRAFACVLERLRALRVIDYVYEEREIHVGVGPDAERLLPLVEALVPERD
jgi:Transglycosylase SLT domain